MYVYTYSQVHGEVSTWEETTVTVLGVIVYGLSNTEIETLPITSAETIRSVGQAPHNVSNTKVGII